MMKRFILTTLAGAALVYGVALLLVFLNQRALLYPAGGVQAAPAQFNVQETQEVSLQTPDGETLYAWAHAPEEGEAIVLYLQGNALALPDRRNPLRTFVEGGYGLLAPSYRGFAGSTGEPTQDGLIVDALSAFAWIEARYPDAPVIIHGHSLGAAVAVQLAARVDAAALILLAPFTAAVDVAAETYSYFPVHALMKDQWLSRDIIADVGEPVLIAQMGRDQVIPPAHSRKLFELASEPKKLVILPDAGHNQAWDYDIWRHWQSFVAEALSTE